MPITTAWAALSSPQLADQPNGPSAFSTLTGQLDKVTIPRFTSVSTRDSAVTTYVGAGNAMTQGMLCYVDGIGIMTYDTGFPGGASWRRYPQDGPRGHLALDRRTASIAFTDATEGSFQQVVFTAALNRWYQATFYGTWRCSAAGSQALIRCRATAGATYSTSGQLVRDGQLNVVENSDSQDIELVWGVRFKCIASPANPNEIAAGQTNLALALANASTGYTTTIMASGSSTQNALWVLDDLGPVA